MYLPIYLGRYLRIPYLYAYSVLRKVWPREDDDVGACNQDLHLLVSCTYTYLYYYSIGF